MVMIQLAGGNDASLEGRKVSQSERDLETQIEEEEQEIEDEEVIIANDIR